MTETTSTVEHDEITVSETDSSPNVMTPVSDNDPPVVERRVPNAGVLGAYALVFFVAEALTRVDPRLQAAAHALIVMVAIAHALRSNRNGLAALPVAVAALSCSRLFALTLPFPGISVPTRVGLVGLASIAMWRIANSMLEGESSATGGFSSRRRKLAKERARQVLALALVAIPLAWISYEVLGPERLVLRDIAGSQWLAVVVAATALSVGALGEELLYRQLLGRVTGAVTHRALILIPAVIWSSTYIGTGQPWLVVVVTGVGVAFMIAYRRSGSILAPAIAHAIISVGSLMVLPTLL